MITDDAASTCQFGTRTGLALFNQLTLGGFQPVAGIAGVVNILLSLGILPLRLLQLSLHQLGLLMTVFQRFFGCSLSNRRLLQLLLCTVYAVADGGFILGVVGRVYRRQFQLQAIQAVAKLRQMRL